MPGDLQTYGEVKRLLAQTPRGDWPSRVNPSLTRSQALDILSKAINTRPDDMRIEDDVRGERMVRNVLRECRSRADAD